MLNDLICLGCVVAIILIKKKPLKLKEISV